MEDKRRITQMQNSEIYAIANFKSVAKGTVMALPISYLLD